MIAYGEQCWITVLPKGWQFFVLLVMDIFFPICLFTFQW